MYLAIDIGGTKTLIARYDDNGSIVDENKFPTNKDYQSFVEELSAAITAQIDKSPVSAIGIAAPGHVEDDTGIIKGFGNLDWKNIDIKSDLSSKFDLPIILDNDANMGAIGEANMGAGEGFRKVLYVTVSTGIGTGITVEGEISPALRESEGGHMLFKQDGKLVPWEEFASGKAFLRHYGKQGKDVDDPRIWEEFAGGLAQGMWDLIALTQPDIIVIGGSIGVHFHKYGKFLQDAVSKFSSDVVDHPEIVQAKDPDNAVINGCFVTAKNYAKSA